MADALTAAVRADRRAPQARGRTGRTVLLLALGSLLILAAGLAGYLQARQAGAAADRGADVTVSASMPDPASARPNDMARDAEVRPGSAPRTTGAGTSARPADPSATDASASDAALRWPLWDFQLRQPIPPRDPPLTPPPWRLIGASSAGGVWKLIILREGKAAPEFYGTGDSLPGGYVVGQITDEDVTLIQGKRALLLSYIGTR